MNKIYKLYLLLLLLLCLAISIAALIIALKNERQAGLNGTNGAPGSSGNNGATGPSGNDGSNGLNGATGPSGTSGPSGTNGLNGATGPSGPSGSNGLNGATGPVGPTGPSGETISADFFSLMPPNNSATIAVGGSVQFEQNGPNNSSITKVGFTQFILPDIATYQITFLVTIAEAGQLILTLDSGSGPVEIVNSVTGRATGTSQIIGISQIETTVINSILTLNNPSGNSTALTIMPSAGGTHPASAHIIIEQLYI